MTPITIGSQIVCSTTCEQIAITAVLTAMPSSNRPWYLP